MLPLVTNVLPSTPLAPTPSSSATPAVALQAGADSAGAASRQQLATAVNATSQAVAYFPGTPPAKQTQAANRTLQVQVPPPTGDYIEMEAPAAPVPPPQIRPNGPITLGIPLTAQLNAQYIAQQPTVVARASADPFAAKAPEPEPTPEPAKKETPFSKARGTAAYTIAAIRAQIVNSVPEPA